MSYLEAKIATLALVRSQSQRSLFSSKTQETRRGGNPPCGALALSDDPFVLIVAADPDPYKVGTILDR